MAQTRIHDYRGPRSSENLNGHLVGVVPSGIYEGFHVFANGNISPGMLITPEGVRIRDTETISVVVPAADPVNPRIDLVVCTHEYEKTVPAPVATFVVVQGVPAADPSWPDLPAHSMLVAACRMEALAVAWTDIQQLGYPVKVYNAEHQDDHSWLILRGSVATTRTLFNPNTGVFAAWIVPPGTYGDDDPITWGAPAFEYSADGVLQILTHIGKAVGAHAASAISIADAGDRYTADEVEAALQEIAGAGRTAETVKGNATDIATIDTDKLDKAGGTISGDLVLQGKVTFDADDVADVAFDDWIAFTRWIQPCQGNSTGWTNNGYHWLSDGLTTLHIPVDGIVGAELVSVDVGLGNDTGGGIVFHLGFTTADYADHLVAGQVTFGKVDGLAGAGMAGVTNVPLLDPAIPHDPLPFAFDGSHTLWLRVKSDTAGIIFNGAKLNYRRKRIAV